MKRALLLMLLCTQACSLMGLDEYELRECDPGVRCHDLNEGLEGECMQYACSESGRGCELRPFDRDYDGVPSETLCEDVEGIERLDCDDAADERTPGKAEACDGIDNDCDGYVDEGLKLDKAPEEITIGASTTQLSTARANDALLVAITQQDDMRQTYDAERLTLLGDSASEIEPLATGGNCRSGDDQGEPCSFAQLAFATAGETLIGAGIHRGQCIQGHLRAGAGSSDDFTLTLGELSGESNVALGIDINPDNRCTQHGSCRGAHDPAIAALSVPNLGAQALLVWLSPSTDGECAEGSAGSVIGMGLFAGIDTDDAAFVSGSAGGHGELFSDAVASGPPAIVAFDGGQVETGYFVAFPTEDSVALHFVPRFRDRVSVTTDVFTGEIPAESARLAALPGALHTPEDATTAAGLGVAYAERRGERHALRFAPLRFDQDADEPFEITGTPVQLETEGEIVGSLSVAYAPDGFSAKAPYGGWLVTWIERIDDEAVLRAARIAEADLHVLGKPLTLARGAVDHSFTYLKPAANEAPSALFYGFVSDDALRVNRISCL